MAEPFDQDYDTVVAADGTATISISPNTVLRPWVVTQVSIELDGASGYVTCVMRKNGKLVTPMIAVADAAAGDPPVTLAVTDVLTIEWAGAVPGSKATAYVMYHEGTR
jgi:hypothetical protein